MFFSMFENWDFGDQTREGYHDVDIFGVYNIFSVYVRDLSI